MSNNEIVIWVICIAISIISTLVIWVENFVRAKKTDKFLNEEKRRRESEYFHDKVNLLTIEVRELQTRVTNLENQINIVKQ